ncbi:glycoside hydrolase family 2 protein [Cohnella rhizosphaerae]|nr:hypothetical protein [Cohnella rhizosphaerae]
MNERQLRLDGQWRFLLDRDDRYADAPPPDGAFGEDAIQVPGSWEEQGYGDAPAYGQIDTWTKVREYEGAAWYRTTFCVGDAEKSDWTGQATEGALETSAVHAGVRTGAAADAAGDAARATEAAWALTIAGARWTTEVWVNGAYAGRRDSLSAPHVYRLRGVVRHGANELAIRVDNRMRLPLADSHIHTRHTATAWGGITGGVRLARLAPARIETVAIAPDPAAGIFRCRVTASGALAAGDAVVATFQAPNGETFRAAAALVEAASGHDGLGDRHEGLGGRHEGLGGLDGRQDGLGDNGARSHGKADAGFVAELICAVGDAPAFWTDARPQLYEAAFAVVRDGETLDRTARRPGLRRLAAEGKRLLLNGHPVWLRGYVDCCIFPLTGYPVWDKDHYDRQFRIAKSYGFNHVRLHGWTAPEPFWEAADEAGMLVQAELPHWSAHYQPREAEPPADVDAFLEAELRRIYDQLNAHPSFVLFAMGNELVKDNGHPPVERAGEAGARAGSFETRHGQHRLRSVAGAGSRGRLFYPLVQLAYAAQDRGDRDARHRPRLFRRRQAQRQAGHRARARAVRDVRAPFGEGQVHGRPPADLARDDRRDARGQRTRGPRARVDRGDRRPSDARAQGSDGAGEAYAGRGGRAAAGHSRLSRAGPCDDGAARCVLGQQRDDRAAARAGF